MEISAKEIKLSGSVLYIPIYSMRDKKTGQYIPSMDGNINSMLHRLYNNRHDVNEVMIAIPNIKKLKIGELEKLRKSIKSIGINNVDYLPLSWLYGSSVGNTRLKALAFEDKFDTEYIEPTVTVCELPIDIKSSSKVVYNYNWNAVDKTNDLLNISFKREVELSKKHDTFLFSDIQYRYWVSQTRDIKTKFWRSIDIYSSELFEEISQTEIDNFMDDISIKELNFFSNVLPKEDIVFYPMRVDDPRYEFKGILDYVEESNKLMVITNPTNIEIEYNHHIIDLSDSVNKRGLYFKILSKLKSSDRIIHACDDVHISLFEQLSLSEADVTFNDTMHILDIDTYIKS